MIAVWGLVDSSVVLQVVTRVSLLVRRELGAGRGVGRFRLLALYVGSIAAASVVKVFSRSICCWLTTNCRSCVCNSGGW